MSAFRFYTRTQDIHLLKQCFITLDLTVMDFRSNPPLNYYVKNWFTDVDDLIDFLSSPLDKSLKLNERITLIVSDLLANITCHVLHAIFPQIVRIIIVGKRLCSYGNVERFFDVQSLVDHLSFTLRDRKRLYLTFDSWPVERTSYDLNKHTAQFLWHRYFYTILSRLNNTNVAREELLESVRVFHTKQIDIVRGLCEEFEKSYKSTDILKWYNRDSFFYLLLNRTLRSIDINHIFALRYVIFDLENYLQENYHQNPPVDKVYRGQQMHLNEIREIESNVGGLIGLTAFWSTSRSEETALNFTEIWPPERRASGESVLFSITIPSHVKRDVYLDISPFRTIDYELEVLFSFRSIFRIAGARRNETNQLWYIDLTLIDEHDDQFLSIMHPWYTSTTHNIGYRCFFTPQIVQSKENFYHILTLDNEPFLAFKLLVDIMLRLDQNQFARNELLELSRNYYANNSAELKKIDEFEHTYTPNDAIKWYTKDCFVYRLINSSLGIKSIDFIFKLRYIIHDLHNQLARMQMQFLRLLPPNQPIQRLYRGLRMNSDNLVELQKNKGNLVSMNTFLSTTSDEQAALYFAGDGNVDDNFVSVIYQIDVDTTVKHSIPFAEINYESIFKDEDEVLFSMAAVFRVGEIEQLKDHLWKIGLTLTTTEDEQWNLLIAHLNSK